MAGITLEQAQAKLDQYLAAETKILLGQEKGPRFGSFVELYGLKETVAMIDAALAGTLGQA